MTVSNEILQNFNPSLTYEDPCLNILEEIDIGKEIEIPLEDCDEEEETEFKEEAWDDIGTDQFVQEPPVTQIPTANQRAEVVPSSSFPPS